MPARFKPFPLMTPEDYAAVGLMCGLEVHQQLLTRRKLFCRCPAGRYSDAYDAEILRHMRPTLSELGEYDGTALMEKKTRKNIYYRLHRETVCTYEMDDTPPFFMDEEALDTALELALLLRLNLVGELHVARKQYLDGSIPTGFQRTTILGVDGWLPYGERRIGIAQLGLEEDSCREVADDGHDRIYLTDRLGMPLIEVVTYPDMRTPQETAEVCQIVRRLCRSTGRVRTGYGAAREDVNVSVRGGTRIEIKGVPQITRIPHLIYNEALRQCSLLAIRDELKGRGVTPDTLCVQWKDVTALVAATHFDPLRAAVETGHKVKCVRLCGFAGILSQPTQEHTSFAKEFSDRIRVIACLTRLPNMVHSDTASETLSGKHWKELRRRMRADHNDALVLVWGSDADTETACREVELRAREATIGVPSDTRQAYKDGTNGFERVLPGAERMYPDTDLPPLAITEERKRRVQARISGYFWEREERYRRLKLPEDTIELLAISPRAGLFDRLIGELKIDPVFAAVVLVQQFKAWRRTGLKPEEIPDAVIEETFRRHATGALPRRGVSLVLEHLLCATPDAALAPAEWVDRAVQALELVPARSAEIEQRLASVLRETRFDDTATPRERYDAAMGRLARPLLGRADDRALAERLATALGFTRQSADAEKVKA